MKRRVPALCTAAAVLFPVFAPAQVEPTSFEAADGYVTGTPLYEYPGWSVRFGQATISNEQHKNGSQSLRLHGGTDPSVEIERAFEFEDDVAFIDFWIKPVVETGLNQLSAIEVNGSSIAFVRAAGAGGQGTVKFLRGNDSRLTVLEEWPDTGYHFWLEKDGRRAKDWLRVTIRQDMNAWKPEWDLYLDGYLVEAGIDYSGRMPQLSSWLAFGSRAAADVFIDSLSVTHENPLFVDADFDGVSDTWASDFLAGLGLSGQTFLRDTVTPEDSKTYIKAYVDDRVDTHFLEREELFEDSDADKMPDFWENAWNLNPQDPSDALLDPDVDGLNSLEEYRLGTNPRSNPLYELRLVAAPPELGLPEYSSEMSIAAMSPRGTMAISTRNATNETVVFIWDGAVSTTLPLPTNCREVEIRSVDDSGRVAGSFVWAGSETRQAFICGMEAESFMDLGFSGTIFSEALAVNGAGVAAGVYRETSSSLLSIFISIPAESSFLTMPYSDVISCKIFSVAENGDFAANITYQNEGIERAYFYSRTGNSISPVVPESLCTGHSRINGGDFERGFTGYYTPISSPSTPKGFLRQGETLYVLPPATGSVSRGIGASRSNAVAGTCGNAAALWRVGENIVTSQLPALTGAQSTEPVGVSADGDILGLSLPQGSPVLWRDGSIFKLLNCLQEGGTLTISSIKGISDSGMISGTGLVRGRKVAFTCFPAVDVDGDGMSADWEGRYGLSDYDSTDAFFDTDRDGLNNGSEYLANTDPTLRDTDHDGMPDGWEVANRLDPKLIDDAALDYDRDRLTNLQEYRTGGRPLGDYQIGAISGASPVVSPSVKGVNHAVIAGGSGERGHILWTSFDSTQGKHIPRIWKGENDTETIDWPEGEFGVIDFNDSDQVVGTFNDFTMNMGHGIFYENGVFQDIGNWDYTGIGYSNRPLTDGDFMNFAPLFITNDGLCGAVNPLTTAARVWNLPGTSNDYTALGLWTDESRVYPLNVSQGTVDYTFCFNEQTQTPGAVGHYRKAGLSGGGNTDVTTLEGMKLWPNRVKHWGTAIGTYIAPSGLLRPFISDAQGVRDTAPAISVWSDVDVSMDGTILRNSPAGPLLTRGVYTFPLCTWAHGEQEDWSIVSAGAISPDGKSIIGTALHNGQLVIYRLKANDDSDDDEMPDDWEHYYFGSAGSSPGVDSDSDGWTNLQEYTHGTDPRIQDTDGDLIADSTDPNPLVSSIAAATTPLITELMADNEDTDLPGAPAKYNPDWLEMQNPTPAAVSLNGWRIDYHKDINSGSPSGTYNFPSTLTIPAGGFLLLVANQNAVVEGNTLPTTEFKLKKEGAQLKLRNASGTVVQNIIYSAVGADQSWGTFPDFTKYGFCQTPTPGASNSIVYAESFPTAAVTASVLGGFHEAPFTVTLTEPENSHYVLYTTDASDPSMDNPASLHYESGSTILIQTTTVLKARAYRDSYSDSPLMVCTYLFKDHMLEQKPPPEFSADSVNSVFPVGFDRKIIQAALESDPASDPVSELDSIPSVAISVPWSRLFGSSELPGAYINPLDESEYSASFEFIDPNAGQVGPPYASAPAGLKVTGNSSRNPQTSLKHSFLLKFKKEYGASKLNSAVFATGPTPDAGVLNSFDELILRHPTHDSWTVDVHPGNRTSWEFLRHRATYIKDEWAIMKEREMNPAMPVTRRRWVHVFLNGCYWGIYQLGERPSAKFLESRAGEPATEDSFDVIKDSEAQAGDKTAWQQLRTLAQDVKANPSNPGSITDPQSRLGKVAAMLDLPQFARYLVLNVFMNNRDWPEHNYVASRRRDVSGSKFIFHVWDAEWSFVPWTGEATENVWQWLNVNSEGPGELFVCLKNAPDFSNLLQQTLTEMTASGGPLHLEECRDSWVTLANTLEPVLGLESARWGSSKSYQPFTQENWTKASTWVQDEFFTSGQGLVPGTTQTASPEPSQTSLTRAEVTASGLTTIGAVPAVLPLLDGYCCGNGAVTPSPGTATASPPSYTTAGAAYSLYSGGTSASVDIGWISPPAGSSGSSISTTPPPQCDNCSTVPPEVTLDASTEVITGSGLPVTRVTLTVRTVTDGICQWCDHRGKGEMPVKPYGFVISNSSGTTRLPSSAFQTSFLAAHYPNARNESYTVRFKYEDCCGPTESAASSSVTVSIPGLEGAGSGGYTPPFPAGPPEEGYAFTGAAEEIEMSDEEEPPPPPEIWPEPEVHLPPEISTELHLSHTTGSRFRQIGLNGLPIPGSKEQLADETDQPTDETSVDSFTLRLNHTEYDAHIPLQGGELSLSAKRVVTPFVWKTSPGGPPPLADKPFGACWSTSLAPTLCWSTNVPGTDQPDAVTVTDEAGATHRFLVLYHRPSGTSPPELAFLPDVNNRGDLEDFANELKAVYTETTSSGFVRPRLESFVFRRKFGTTITFKPAFVRQDIVQLSGDDVPSPDPDAPPQDVKFMVYRWFRVASGDDIANQTDIAGVTDRFGNELRYTFAQADCLIPVKITRRGTGIHKQVMHIKVGLFTSSTGNQRIVADPEIGKLDIGEGLSIIGAKPFLNSGSKYLVEAVQISDQETFNENETPPTWNYHYTTFHKESGLEGCPDCEDFPLLLAVTRPDETRKYYSYQSFAMRDTTPQDVSPTHPLVHHRVLQLAFRGTEHFISVLSSGNSEPAPPRNTGVFESKTVIEYQRDATWLSFDLNLGKCYWDASTPVIVTDVVRNGCHSSFSNRNAPDLNLDTVPDSNAAALKDLLCNEVISPAKYGTCLRLPLKWTEGGHEHILDRRVIVTPCDQVASTQSKHYGFVWSEPVLRNDSEIADLIVKQPEHTVKFNGMILWTKAEMFHPGSTPALPVREAAWYHTGAGMAEWRVRDFSGNYTLFEHNDLINPRGLKAMSLLSNLPSGAQTALNNILKRAYHREPNTEIRVGGPNRASGVALGASLSGMDSPSGIRGLIVEPAQTGGICLDYTGALVSDLKTTYIYSPGFRIMKSSTSPRGIVTTNGIDEAVAVDGTVTGTGLRLNTIVTLNGSTLREEKYFYNSQSPSSSLPEPLSSEPFKGFMSRKEISTGVSNHPSVPFVPPATTRYTADGLGYLSSTSTDTGDDPLVSSQTNDLFGRTSTSTDTRGKVTTYTRDKMGRVIQVALPAVRAKLTADQWSSPESAATTTLYDSLGRKVRTTDVTGRRTWYVYDSFGFLATTIVDFDGNGTTQFPNDISDHKIESRADKTGRPLLTQDPGGLVTRNEYDVMGRLAATHHYGNLSRDNFAALANSLQIGRAMPMGVNPIWTARFDYGLRNPDGSFPSNPGGSVFDTSNFHPLSATDNGGYRTIQIYDPFYRNTATLSQISQGPAGRFALVTRTFDKAGNVTSETRYRAPVAESVKTSLQEHANTAAPGDSAPFPPLATVAPFDSISETQYDGLNQSVAVTSPDGRQSVLHYGAGGKVWQTEVYRVMGDNGTPVTPPQLLTTTRTEYDAAGRPVKAFLPSPSSGSVSDDFTSTHYLASGDVGATTDIYGNETTYEYDEWGRKVKEVSPAIDAENISATDSLPSSTATVALTGYNIKGEKAWIKDARGHVTSMTYDPLGRVESTSRTVAGYSPVQVQTTENRYDMSGNLIAVKISAGSMTANGPAAFAWTFNSYDSLNRLEATVSNIVSLPGDPEPGVRKNGNFLILSSPRDKLSDPDRAGRSHPQAVSNTYDVVGNLVGVAAFPYVSFSGGSAAIPLYSLRGNSYYTADTSLASTAHYTTFTYDGLKRKLLTVWDPGTTRAKAVTERYDALVHTGTTDARRVVTSYSYDRALRLTGVTYQAPPGPAYSEADSPFVLTPGWTYSYDPGTGAIQSVVRTGNSSSPENTTYTYDRRGRLLTEKSAGVTHTHAYDFERTGDRPVHLYRVVYGSDQTNPRTLVSTYDPAGRARTITDTPSGGTARTTEYGYTRTGGIARRRITEGTSQLHTELASFDGAGRVSQFSTFGPFPTSASTSTIEGARINTINYGFDLADNLTGMGEIWRSSLSVGSGPGGGTMQQRSVGNVYDAGRRLIKEVEFTYTGTQVSRTVISEYFYDGDNNRTRKNVTVTEGSVTKTTCTLFEYGNGVSADNYDPRFNSNQMASCREYNGTTLSPAYLRKEVFYTYDANGNRTRAATRQTNGTNIVEQYQWDPQDRLVGYRRSNNMTRELMAATYGYDYRCRRVYRSEQIRDASADNAFVVFSGGTSVREHAAPVPLSVGGQSTYVFSATALPAPHPPALGTLAAPVVETIRGSDLGGGIGGILYTHRPGNASGDRARFNSYNSRGDVVTQSNETGTITWAATYEAFGKRTQEKGLNKDRQRANTKEEDPTGLLNEGFRYRDLVTGEFISRDPAGFVDGPNVYTYVRQNPWTSFDPMGLDDEQSGVSIFFGRLGSNLYSTVDATVGRGPSAYRANQFTEKITGRPLSSGPSLLPSLASSLERYTASPGRVSLRAKGILPNKPQESLPELVADEVTDLLLLGLPKFGSSAPKPLPKLTGESAPLLQLEKNASGLIHAEVNPAALDAALLDDVAAKSSPTGISVTPPTAASLSDLDFVQKIATKAESTGVRLGKGAAGTGPAQGTWKHDYAKRVLRQYQKKTGEKMDLLSEESFLGKSPAGYGTVGSARPDVFNPVTGQLFDYKFVLYPGRGLGAGQQAKNASNVPGVTSQHEINP